jgi:hypothetical protein
MPSRCHAGQNTLRAEDRIRLRGKSEFFTHKACLHRRRALEDHERLVFQTLVSSMVDALSQRGRGATRGLMLLLLQRFEEI